MTSITQLQPQLLWKHFDKICSIPHPSKHEEKILNYLIDFAKKHNLEYSQDIGENIIIKKPATKGYENCEITALQAHVDMVPQKNSDKVHDFTKDPIEPIIDGEWVRANNTTLGADNGIGLASILAILESTDIPHGPLEALLTTDEETGMTGANKLVPGSLDAKYMINTDTEDEQDVTVGCAGGIDANFYFEYNTAITPSNSKIFEISISGLKGGHSGFEIILERANANLILIELCNLAIKKYNGLVIDIFGGNMRNAIPREGHIRIAIPESQTERFTKYITSFLENYKLVFSETDPQFSFEISEGKWSDKVISHKSMLRIIQALKACPNGVISFEAGEEKQVKTSTNISIISTGSKMVEINCLLRSSDTSEKMKLAKSMETNFSLFGAKSEFTGDYPSWQPVWDSKILNLVKEAYAKHTTITPEVKVVHAGLECGLFSGKFPDMEFISFGPNIRGPHSPEEKVEIRTVEQYWKILCSVLKNIPKKA